MFPLTLRLACTVVSLLAMSACSDGTSPSASNSSTEQTAQQKFAATLKAAEQGDVEAQHNLGLMYANGDGVAKDAAQAVEWYRKAAEQGYAPAQNSLGFAYNFGQGVTRDLAQAVEWVRKAAEQGYAPAQDGLGFKYHYGDGVTRDAAEAVEWYRKAAEQGFASAQYNLGTMYYYGDGVAKDAAQAVEWLRKAAEQGFALAQYNLGFKYHYGDGVTKDAAQAVEWYRKAAEQGYSPAQYNLGVMYADGDGVAKSAAQAVEWYRKAAEQGYAPAQYNLGVMYYDGDGVIEDKVLAYAWLNLAAANGDPQSIRARDSVEKGMSKQQIQEAQQLASERKPGQGITRASTLNPITASASVNTQSLKKRGTGTIFIVSNDGHAVTNHHVINGCAQLRIEGREGAAKLLTHDKVNDLALLQIPGQIRATAAIAKVTQELRQGEEIVAFGFPLNAMLSSGGNLTPGVISALTGLGNNTNQLQITAPIQPGSSGSPVLNKKGGVIGVVSMKLSDEELVKRTGSLAQNVNFAVSGQTLKTFLDTHKVAYRTAGLLTFDKSPADLADEARKWTTVVECWK